MFPLLPSHVYSDNCNRCGFQTFTSSVIPLPVIDAEIYRSERTNKNEQCRPLITSNILEFTSCFYSQTTWGFIIKDWRDVHPPYYCVQETFHDMFVIPVYPSHLTGEHRDVYSSYTRSLRLPLCVTCKRNSLSRRGPFPSRQKPTPSDSTSFRRSRTLLLTPYIWVSPSFKVYLLDTSSVVVFFQGCTILHWPLY